MELAYLVHISFLINPDTVERHNHVLYIIDTASLSQKKKISICTHVSIPLPAKGVLNLRRIFINEGPNYICNNPVFVFLIFFLIYLMF